jgi:hypothetical protein
MKRVGVSLLLAFSLSAFGQSEPAPHAAVFLTTAGAVLDACNSRFPEAGIMCAVDGAAPAPLGQYAAGVSLSQAQELPWDRGHGFKLYGVLKLSTQRLSTVSPICAAR